MKILDIYFNEADGLFEDASGFNVNISSSGVFRKSIPISSLSQSSILLEPTNSISINSMSIAKRSHEYEDFSISLYFKSGSVFSSVEQEILYDSTNAIGLVFKNGNLIFRITDSQDNAYECIYKLSHIGDSYFVVASYSKGIMSLSVNQQEVSIKSVDSDFLFKSTSTLSLSSDISSDYILIDKVSISNKKMSYEEISNEIKISSFQQNMAQICSKDNPIYFALDRATKPIEYGFSYKTNKSFNEAELIDLRINSYGLVTLTESSGSGIGYLNDSYYFPPLSSPGNNQINWYSDSGGVSVEYSLDDITYLPVNNHSNIPGFQGGLIYFKVTLQSADLSTNIPYLSNLSFVCYSDNKMLSSNSLYEIDTDFDYILMGETLTPISHSYYSGIKTISGGFKINYLDNRTTEFMFMPSSLSENFLVDCGSSYYSWSEAGVIDSSGISGIWVNGENVGSETSVSNIFKTGMWHHVIIQFSSNQTSDIYFNQSQDGLTVGPNNLYTNIAIYDSTISDTPLNRYNQIVNRSYEISVEETLAAQEEGFSSFRVEKVIVSTQ